MIRTRQLGAVIAALLTITAISAVGGVGASTPPGGINQAGTVDDGLATQGAPSPDINNTSKAPPKLSSQVVQLVEEAENGETDSELVSHANGQTFILVRIETLPGEEGAVADLVGRNDGAVRNQHPGLVVARVPIDSLNAFTESSAVAFVRTPVPLASSKGAITSEGLGNMNVTDQLHSSGINGSGVTVAVIDSGFNASNPEIESNVVAMHNFSIGGGPFNNQSGQHGTATSELVVDTAPNVSLILIQVSIVSDIYTAIDHIEQNTSTDVVSMSLGVRTGPFDGTSQLDDAIATSVANGTTWFISAGNDANGQHLTVEWNDPDANRWLNVSGNDETIDLLNAPTSGRIYVNWNDFPSTYEDYDAYLYDSTGTLIDSSTDTQDGSFAARPVEIVQWSGVTPAYLAIHNSSANGTAEFDIFTTDGVNLEYNTSSRSIGRPATEETVISVGATYFGNNLLEPFSARGPTIDGDRKPEIVAPDGVSSSVYGLPENGNGFFGTSAAAPHAAGVGALLVDANSSLSPTDLKSILQSTATPLHGTEPNNQTGYGLVNATAAIDAAESGAQPVAIQQNHGVTTRTGDRNTTKQVAIRADQKLSLDNGTNYRFRVTNEDAGQSVTIELNGSVEVPADNTLAFLLYDGTGSKSATPEIWAAGQAQPMPADVVNNSIPTASGVTNFSVALIDASSGDTIDTTGTHPSVIGYEGVLQQNSTSGTVQLSIPADTVPTDAGAELILVKDSLADGTPHSVPLTFDEGAGEFRAIINASNFTEGDYEWQTIFTWQTVRVLQVHSPGLANENITLVGGPTEDSTVPNVSNAQATDVTDFDGNVSHGDAVKVNVTADDNGTGLQSVVANASHFGNDSVVLTDPDGDGVFNGTFTVDGGQASANGSYAIEVTATDGSGNTNSTTTNALQLNTTGDVTAPQITKYTVQNIGFHEYQISFNSSEQLAEIRLTIVDSNGNTVRTLDRSDFSEFGSGPYSYTNFSTTLDDAGTYTFTLEAANDSAGNNGGGNATTVNIVVDSVSITANETIDQSHLGFDIALSGGLLQVQLQNSSKQFAPAKYDLRSLGADSNTQFWINFTVVDYTPRLLLGAGRNAEWTVTSVGPNTTAVNISVTGANVQYNESKLFDPSRPWSKSDTADVSANVSVGMAITDMNGIDLFNDTMLMTDAQEFGFPRYDEANDTLTLFVGAPHLNVKGNVNQGFFDAFLPTALLNEWNVSDPANITVTAMGNTTEPARVENTSDGIRLFIPITYSSGDVAISPKTSSTTCINDAVSGGNDKIDLTEIQQAINWWADDIEVPNTGGQTISLTKIQSLINAWADDLPVTC